MDIERPTEVPPRYDHIPESETGYAVMSGDLWIETYEDGEVKFMLRVVPEVRGNAMGHIIVLRALKGCPDVPSSTDVMAAGGWVHGDLTDLDALVTALEWFEKNEAGPGEDKFAYEMRTALNHSKGAVRSQGE
jgi:hypothetical protein